MYEVFMYLEFDMTLSNVSKEFSRIPFTSAYL